MKLLFCTLLDILAKNIDLWQGFSWVKSEFLYSSRLYLEHNFFCHWCRTEKLSLQLTFSRKMNVVIWNVFGLKGGELIEKNVKSLKLMTNELRSRTIDFTEKKIMVNSARPFSQFDTPKFNQIQVLIKNHFQIQKDPPNRNPVTMYHFYFQS